MRRLKTDSTPVEAPKDPDASSLFAIYRQFAGPADQEAVRARLAAGGLGWGEMKDMVFESVDAELAGPRERYRELMDDRGALDEILAAGAARARARAQPLMAAVRDAIGIEAGGATGREIRRPDPLVDSTGGHPRAGGPGARLGTARVPLARPLAHRGGAAGLRGAHRRRGRAPGHAALGRRRDGAPAVRDVAAAAGVRRRGCGAGCPRTSGG